MARKDTMVSMGKAVMKADETRGHVEAIVVAG